MTDTLNVELRHTIRMCWKTLRGQQALKKVGIQLDLAAMLPDEFSPERQITNRLSCGDSANRLCEILVGDSLQDYLKSREASQIGGKADQPRTKVEDALREMKATTGRVLVRVNVCGGGAGHSYVFISKFRQTKDPLEGRIYQTNVGCHMDSAFDLIEWIDDPKSYETIDLEKHLDELRRNLTQLGGKPDEQYQSSYMLSTKKLTPKEVSDLRDRSMKSETRACVIFMWRRIDPSVAQKNLRALRETTGQAVKWPTVQTNVKAFRSRG